MCELTIHELTFRRLLTVTKHITYLKQVAQSNNVSQDLSFLKL